MKRIFAWFLGAVIVLVGLSSPIGLSHTDSLVWGGTYSSGSSRSSSSNSGSSSSNRSSSSSSSSNSRGSSYSSGSSSNQSSPSRSSWGSGLGKTQAQDNSSQSYARDNPKPANPSRNDSAPRDGNQGTTSPPRAYNASQTPVNTHSNTVVVVPGSTVHEYYHYGNPGSGWSMDGRDTRYPTTSTSSDVSVACGVIGFILVLILIVLVWYAYTKDSVSKSKRLSTNDVDGQGEENSSDTARGHEGLHGSDCTNAQGVSRSEDYNPLNLCAVQNQREYIHIDKLDYSGKPYKVERKLSLDYVFKTRKLAHKSAMYFIKDNETDVEHVLFCTPVEKPDAASDLVCDTLILKKFDELGYDSGLHNVLNGDTNDFRIDSTGEVFWRHFNGVKSVKAKTSEGNTVEQWVYSRDIQDEGGNTVAEFIIIEFDEDKAWYTIYRGVQISSDLIRRG